LPAPAFQLLEGSTAVLIAAVIEPKEIAVGACNPGELGDGVGHSAEALLALTQGFFGLHAGSDVLAEDDQAADDAGSGVPRLDLPTNPMAAAVGTLEKVLVGRLDRSGQTAPVNLLPASGISGKTS
jgi:hypothetical protein